MTAKHDQLVIVQKYETFLAYVYPIAQNLPRKHGVAKEMFLRDMLGQVELFIVAAKSGQISRIREADAGLTMLRFWIRFLSSPTCGVMTQHQHRTASVQLAEVGRLVGAPGDGVAAKAGDTLTVDYCGIGLSSQSIFDSSWVRVTRC